jgi:transposase
VDVRIPQADEKVDTTTFTFALNKNKLREARRAEGNYLLRSNLGEDQTANLWSYYIQLTEIEAAFRDLKSDLGLRPIYHQKEERIEAHIFVAFLAYCLHVTLRQRLRVLAPGLTPRQALDKFAEIQMVDVHMPTTDGKKLILSRYTHPEKDQQMLLHQLKLKLPSQPPPKVTTEDFSRSA